MHFIRVNLDFFLSHFVSVFIVKEIWSKELRSYTKHVILSKLLFKIRICLKYKDARMEIQNIKYNLTVSIII